MSVDLSVLCSLARQAVDDASASIVFHDALEQRSEHIELYAWRFPFALLVGPEELARAEAAMVAAVILFGDWDELMWPVVFRCRGPCDVTGAACVWTNLDLEDGWSPHCQDCFRARDWAPPELL